ncbi:MAG: UDP-forming cellulose synthase catalytic subunit [Campylobacterales bacterium]|nr:UDP-forming cellulose synthase catalytic subunit [Campylobacterales bacterium]
MSFVPTLEAVTDNRAARWLGTLLVLFAFYMLISAHYRIETQFVIGYGASAFLLIALQFKRLPPFIELLIKILAVVVVLRYMYWRTFASLTYEGFFDYIGAVMLYLAEGVAVIIYLLGIFTSLHLLKRQSINLNAYNEDELPIVDVLIPTYNEPFNIIENTTLAALAMEYPHHKLKVYVCDDGGTDQKCNATNPEAAQEARDRRAYLQDFCRRSGAVYLTRAKNEHAKAGNLNSALSSVHGDLILILDCDHVPAKHFLQQSVGWFLKDEKMFLVQTPHAFYNPDPIERNLRMFGTSISENDMFYRFIQQGHDFWESSFFCGSAALLRRKYIDELGGIAGETITEDAETAIKLHDRGYKSAYISEPMVRGLQAESFGSLIIQRIRWTQGMVQIFLLKNPFLSKQLKWHQKLSYLSASFFWFFAYSRVVFYLAPLMFLFFGLRIYNANETEMLAYVVPHMLMAIMMSYFLYAKVRNPFFSELYETVLSFFTLPAIVQTVLNPRNPTFKVTPKGEDLTKTHVSLLAIPFVLLFILVSFGFVAALYRWITYPEDQAVVIMTAMWNLLNFLLLIAAIAVTSEKGEVRKYIRVPLKRQCTIFADGEAIEANITDIGEGGLNATPTHLNDQIETKLSTARSIEIELGDIDGKSFRAPVDFLRAFGWGKNLVFILKNLDEQLHVRQKIIQIIYANDTVWREFDESHRVMNPIQSFAYIVRQSFKNTLFKEAFLVTFLYFKNRLSYSK